MGTGDGGRARTGTDAVRVLVTGGCGYVGTKLTQALLARTRHQVSVLDTQWFGNHLSPDPRLTVCAGDVRTIDDFDLSRFDTIFHLANIANDPSVDLNPYFSWEVNVLAGMRLIDRAARQGVKQFIFASSASVYGLKADARVTEELNLVPPFTQPPMNNSAEMLAVFDKNVSEARAAIAGASNDHLMGPWSLKVQGKTVLTMPRVAVLRNMVFNHIVHHRGQLTVYLRLNDIPVPGMYGPSADEPNMFG